jgi:hypothetical protein
MLYFEKKIANARLNVSSPKMVQGVEVVVVQQVKVI